LNCWKKKDYKKCIENLIGKNPQQTNQQFYKLAEQSK
jgi:hypothetical protein